MKRGMYVSRSVYQKLKEQNKRLISDIYIMTMTNDLVSRKLHRRYRDGFRMKEANDEFIKDALRSYLKEHPEYDITSPSYNPNKFVTNEKKNNRKSP
jgi:hypothetical protein